MDQYGGIDLRGGARAKAKKKMYKEKHCSPGETDVNNSCLDSDLILKIATILNESNSDKYSQIDTSQNPENIHGDVCIKISEISNCSSEECWLKIKNLMENLGSDRPKFSKMFKPKMPKTWLKDYNEWLGTDDIEKCLNQHVDADKNFYFYGAVPMDFNKCSVSNLCSFDLNKHLTDNKNKIGIVFNTDPSTKGGKHWISMYIDLGGYNLNEPSIYYFDSYGKKPSKHVQRLINKIKKQGEKNNMNILYFFNDHPYQKYDSQCGMYSIHFIKKMLEGLSFDEYLNSKLTDRQMSQLRSEYFIK